MQGANFLHILTFFFLVTQGQRIGLRKYLENMSA